MFYKVLSSTFLICNFLYRFCVVEYRTIPEAEEASNTLNGKVIDGHTIDIVYGKPRERPENNIVLVRNLVPDVTARDLERLFIGAKEIKVPNDKYAKTVKR